MKVFECAPLIEIGGFLHFWLRYVPAHERNIKPSCPFYVSFYCCPICLTAICSASISAVSPAVPLLPWQVNDEA